MSNNFSITGNIAEPKKSQTNDGKPVLNLRVADTPRRKNDQGDWEDAGEALWVGVAIFGDAAAELDLLLSKGATITATGRLVTRSYQRDDGSQGAALEIKSASVGYVRSARQANDGGGFGGAPQSGQWGGQPAQQPAQGGGWSQAGQGGAHDAPPF